MSKPTLNVSLSKHLNAFSCCLLFLYNTMFHSSLLGSQKEKKAESVRNSGQALLHETPICFARLL